MQYAHILPAVFCRRPNRFIAEIEVNGRPATAHVKNTGRCRELLLPGSRVYVQAHPEVLACPGDAHRKTPYSLIAAEKDGRIVNMDSQAPNAVFAEALEEGLRLPGWGETLSFRREVVRGGSRLDFALSGRNGNGFVEVKGVTLEENGIVRFPDAPTERGRRHLLELIQCVEDGQLAAAVFIVQMQDVVRFEPNRRTDPDFADALTRAKRAGVRILAYSCRVTPDALSLESPVPVVL